MKKNSAKFLGTLLLLVSVFSSGLVYGEKPWNFNDDVALLNGVSRIGKNWLIISKKVFNGEHTPSECQKRHEECLIPAFAYQWAEKDIYSLHRKVMAGGFFWERLQQDFRLPAVVIKSKYFETCEIYNFLMSTMDEECTWLPKKLWVDDVDISD